MLFYRGYTNIRCREKYSAVNLIYQVMFVMNGVHPLKYVRISNA